VSHSIQHADRVLSVNIDLDDLRFYRGIHALPPEEDRPTIFLRAVPRFLDLCGRLGIPATLFTISDDLRWPDAVAALRAAVAAGHEVGSHSATHCYDLSRRPLPFIDAEIAVSRKALEDAVGAPVVGFRGPGYNLSDALLAALVQAGYTYDTSILPAPAYWAARATVIGWMRLTGRHSSSIPGRARDFFRRRTPFTWGTVAPGLKEFPITACGMGRLPLIGTTLAAGGPMARHLVRAASGLPFVNVEFHALDFLDVEADGLDPRLLVEPALRIPLDRRIAAFEGALARLVEGRRPSRLADL
jgi:hypothetical protein